MNFHARAKVIVGITPWLEVSLVAWRQNGSFPQNIKPVRLQGEISPTISKYFTTADGVIRTWAMWARRNLRKCRTCKRLLKKKCPFLLYHVITQRLRKRAEKDKVIRDKIGSIRKMLKWNTQSANHQVVSLLDNHQPSIVVPYRMTTISYADKCQAWPRSQGIRISIIGKFIAICRGRF